MDTGEKLERLKELGVLGGLPSEKLMELARLLEPMEAAAGQVIVEEGSVGDCLYFLIDGKVRIEKKIPGAEGEDRVKELAVLSAGDFFGEMALVEEQTRSARAVAATKCLLFTLGREELFAWLKNQPEMTVAFFLTMVRTLSHRLRTTSRELAFLYDLSTLFLEPNPTEQVLMIKVVQNVTHYVEGAWTVAGYVYNEFNDEYDLVAAEGEAAEAVRGRQAPSPGLEEGWQDGKTLWVALPASPKPAGFILLESSGQVAPREREELSRIVRTVAKLLVSAMLNVRHAVEEGLKARLKATAI
jgi:CRP/FNR family cyclic AMP-dependent transcriptional regulator